MEGQRVGLVGGRCISSGGTLFLLELYGIIWNYDITTLESYMIINTIFVIIGTNKQQIDLIVYGSILFI